MPLCYSLSVENGFKNVHFKITSKNYQIVHVFNAESDGAFLFCCYNWCKCGVI